MDDFWEYVSVNSIEFALTLVLAAFTVGLPLWQIHRAKRQRTADLFSEFYAADHYRCVVLPVYRLMRKITALPPIEREAYLDAVVAGWDRSPDEQAMWHALVPAKERDIPPMEQHFQVEYSTEAHTEHEALTSFLYFWVRAHRMLEADLLSERLFQQLFCNSFAYYHRFLDTIRDRVEAAFADEPGRVAEEKPGWIAATRHVERLLDPAACRS